MIYVGISCLWSALVFLFWLRRQRRRNPRPGYLLRSGMPSDVARQDLEARRSGTGEHNDAQEKGPHLKVVSASTGEHGGCGQEPLGSSPHILTLIRLPASSRSPSPSTDTHMEEAGGVSDDT